MKTIIARQTFLVLNKLIRSTFNAARGNNKRYFFNSNQVLEEISPMHMFSKYRVNYGFIFTVKYE